MPTTLTEMLDYIRSDAQLGDLKQIRERCNQRAQTLAVATITVGRQVELHNMKTKYLNGLRCKVTEFDSEQLAVVELDEQSTGTLRRSSRKHRVPFDATSFKLRIPRAGLKALD